MPRIFAANQTWTNGNSTLLWSDPLNWSIGTPGSGDDLIFGTPIPGGSPTITLGAGSLANSLWFRNNYFLTGGDLALTSGGIRTDLGMTATIGSQLTGTGGLTKTGGGALRLTNNSNNYTGTTTISNGSVIINNSAQLGTDASAIVVTGSATRGLGGGSLVLEGGYGSGVNLARGLSLQGLGPITDRSTALMAVRDNTVSGLINSGVGSVNTRIVSTGGNLTMSGGIDVAGTAGTTVSILGGASNSAGSGTYILTGPLTGTGTLEKSGSGTLILTPSSTSGFSGSVRVSSSATGTQSSVRITSPNVLGTRTATTTGAVLDLNGGILEVLMDTPSVLAGGAPALLYGRANTSTIFADHAPGSAVHGGTLTFGAMAFEENTTQIFASRNGYNITVAATPVQGGNNNSTLTNNLAGGTLTFAGAFWSNTENTANRTMTINGNGNTLISGNVTASAAAFDHNLTKQGTGTLQISSTGSTLDGNLNIQNGTVQITDFRSITNNASTINFGTGAGNSIAPVGGTLTTGTATASTAAGLTGTKVLNLVGSTGGGIINASHSFAAPLILGGNLTSTALGTANYTLGGTVSTQENIVNGVISNSTAAANTTQLTANAASGATTLTLGSVDGIVVGATISGTNIPGGATVTAINPTTRVVTISAALTAATNGGATITVAGVTNLTGVTKTDAALWALAGTNTYTGATSVLQGTLRLKANAGASTIVADASPISLGVTGNVQNSGGTLELLGVNAAATTENLGALSPTTGANTVRLTSGGGGAAANLVFSSLGTVANGTGTNFATAVGGGGTVTLTGATNTNGIVNPQIYFEGADYAASTAGVIGAATYTTAAGSLTAGNTQPYLLNSNITQTASATVNGGIKLTGATTTYTLNAGFTTTINNGAGTAGGILVSGSTGALITGGTGITTGGAGTLAVRVDGVSDQLTIASVLTSGTTGGLTKNGAGTLILSGTNAQTGATNINEGTVRLSGTGRLSGANVTTNIRSGATLDLNGVGSGTAIGQFNGGGTVTNSNATTALLTVGNNNGAGTFSGVIQNGTGIVNVSKVGTGAQTWSGVSTYTGSTTIASTGLVTVSTLANIGSDSSIGRGDSTSAATNAASLVFTGTTGGISYNGITAASTNRLFTLNGAANGGGQIANASAVNAPLAFTNTGAIAFGTPNVAQVLTLGGASTADNSFAPLLQNNGTATLGVTKIGAGNWVLTNTGNSYTGITTVGTGTTAGGTLQAVDASTLPVNSPLLLGAGTTGGGQFLTSGDFVRNLVATPVAGTGTVTVGATTATTAGVGFAASGSKLVVSFGGLATPTALTWGAGGFMGVSGTSTGAFVLNSAISLAEIEVRNPINLNGALRTFDVADNGNTGADFATITGVLSGTGTSGVTKAGAGILQLFGANTYTGQTSVTVGTLAVTSLGLSTSPSATSVGDSTVGNTDAGAVLIGNAGTGGATLQYIGAGETSDRKIRFNSTTGGPQIHADGSGALILTNVANDFATPTGAKTLSLRGSNTAGNMITSNLTNDAGGGTLSVTVDGGATWILSGNNTYSGNTSVSAGALGIGSNSGAGTGTLVGNNSSIFAHGADRSIANNYNHPNNINQAFIGDYSLSIGGTYINASAANSNVITNTIAAGKSLTLNNITNNAITDNRSLTFQGTGDYNITGAITTTTAFNLNPVFSTTGTATISGAGSNYWSNPTTAGTLTLSAGSIKLGASEVIPHGAGTGANGNVVISPAAAVTATFDLNGFNETINGLTANSAGNVVINNSAVGGATLTVGDTALSGASTVTFGGGAGTYTLQNTGGALALTKVGTGTANFSGTLTYTGATTASNGTLNLNSAVASPVLNVGASGTLKLVGGLTTPGNLTSVTVAGTAGAAFTGGTLSFASSVGTPFNNLTTLNLGGGSGTSWLELDAGDSGTDTLTTSAAAIAANIVHFLIKDIDISNGGTYNLLSAASGLTSGGATYNFTLAGYTGSILNVSDTLVSITAGTLITNDIYWAGGTSPATTMWNTIDGGGNTNFSSDLAGTIPETSLPGKGQKIIFVANSITGGGALSTTLEQSFKVNALEFKQSTTAANTPLSITIAPGTVASNSLNISPSSSASGLNLFTNGSPVVNISAPFVAGAAQTWTTSDSVTLTNGTTIAGTTVTVTDTTGLRPGMTITGSGIPAGATIASITNGTTFELSAAATAGTGQTFYAAQQLNMSGAITGTADITKAGSGKVVLSAASSGYTGTYFANGGITEMTNATALSGIVASPGAGAPVSIGSGGTFYYNNGTSSTVSNNLTLNGGTLSVGGNNQTYSGDVNVAANSSINLRDLSNATPGATVRNITLSGTISGSNAITVDSVNTATAGNQLSGTLTINKGSSGWNGPLNFTRGTVVFTNVAGSGNLTPYVGFDGDVNFNQFGRAIYRNIDGATLSRGSSITYAAGAVGEFSVDNVGALAANYTLNQNGAVNLNAGSIVRLVVDTASSLNFGGGIVLNGNASITAVGGDADSLVSINTTGISGTGNLAINDEAGAWAQTSSRLAINAAGTFTGNSTLNEGTLIFGHKDALSSGSLTITAAAAIQANTDLTAGGAGPIPNAVIANAALTMTGTSNFELSGLVSGTAGIVKSGTSTVILSSANTYAGTTTVNNGTLRYGIASAIPSTSAVTLNPNATGNIAILDLNGLNGTVASLTIGGTGQTASSAAIVQTGIGTLTLGGNISTNATGNPTTTPIITGNISLGAANRTITVANSTGSVVDLDIQAVISGTGVGFTKAGAGILQLSNTNTYTGNTTLLAGAGNTTNGVIAATASNALGTGPVALNFNTGAVTAQLALSGGITLGNSSITTTGAGSDGTTSGIIRNVSGSNTITGLLNLTGGGGSSTYRSETGSTLTVSGNVGGVGGNTNRIVTLVGGGNFAFSGNITNTNDATASTVGLDVGNTGTTTLSGNNTYTLATNVLTGATLVAGSTTALSSASATTVTGTLRLAGFSNTVGSLAGAGTVENAGATDAVLSSSSFSGFTGLIQDGVGAGALSIAKFGAGTSTIAGANSFSGKTVVTNGILSVAAVDANGTATQPLGTHTDLDLGVAATSSGTLLYTGAAATFGKNINALGNGGDTIQNGGTGLLTLSGILTKAGTTLTLAGGASGITVTGSIVGAPASSDLNVTGLVTLASANTFNGPAIVNSGATLNVNHAGAIPAALSINGGTIDNTSGSAITLSSNPVINVNGNFTFSGSNNLNLGTGAVTLNANHTVTLNAGTLTIGGSIAGAFNLTGTGPGTLLLTGASTYSGTTTVQGGATFNVGGNGSLGDTSSGTVVSSGSALVLNNVNYTDPEPLNITGTGTGGAGALVGGGTSGFAGPITLGGNATIGSGGGTFSLSGGIDKTGTVLTLSGGGTFNISGSGITGNTGSPNSDLVVSGTTVNLNVANTYNGPTFIQNAGVLNANVVNSLPTANGRTAVSMDNTAGNILNLAASQFIASLAGGTNDAVTLGANNLTIGAASGGTVYSGIISGVGGTVTKDLSSTLTFTQANTYSGGTTVSGGILNVTNSSGSATGTGELTIAATGNLAGTGIIAPDANNNIVINGSVFVGNSTLGSPVASSLGLSTSGTGSTLVGSTGRFYFDLFSGAGSGTLNPTIANDYISLTGSLTPTIGSMIILTSSQSGYAIGDAWRLFDFAALGSNITTNAFTFDDSGLSLGVGQYGQFDYTTGIYSITGVPEPSRSLLALIGLLLCGLRRRRKMA
jgi:autotransporter-associated beta strand protein